MDGNTHTGTYIHATQGEKDITEVLGYAAAQCLLPMFHPGLVRRQSDLDPRTYRPKATTAQNYAVIEKQSTAVSSKMWAAH